MKLCLFFAAISMLVLMGGCNMFKSWQAIPPPGGCDQCHTAPISKNWSVAYKAPTLSDEKGKLSFQTEQYNLPNTTKPSSSLELRKVQELKCFECHNAPNIAHKERTGRFHH
jgi:hypothetical protein